MASNPDNAPATAIVAFLYCGLGRFSMAGILLERAAANDFSGIPYAA
jgi:hypothetical protein